MSLVRPILLIAPLLTLACHGSGDMNKFGTQGSGAGGTAPAATSSSSGEVAPTVTGAPGDDGSDAAGPDMGEVPGTTTGEAPVDECVQIFETATKQLPADIILVIDNSGSMEIEAASVKANMNKFSGKIIASGVDAHVVLISAIEGKNGMCIEPPLGGGGCPLADSKLPTFLHIDHKVGSFNALQKLLDRHADWKDQMRPDARKHIVVVSDDNSELDAKTFDAAFKALDPSYAEYRFHGIVGKNDATDPVWCASEPVCCDLTAAAGKVYLDLINKTDGVYGDLCKQDFTPVFDALSSAVIQNSGLACNWQIPAPPEDALIDLADVHVDFDDGMGVVLPIAELATPAACADADDGWYYDKPEAPGKLSVCPQTCTKMQLAPKGSIKILFGCKPISPQ
jgi:hypothetical protein